MTRFDSGATEPDRQVFLEVTPGTVHKLLGAVGAKLSVGGSWLLTGTVLFPLQQQRHQALGDACDRLRARLLSGAAS